jgi:hypothetical protein
VVCVRDTRARELECYENRVLDETRIRFEDFHMQIGLLDVYDERNLQVLPAQGVSGLWVLNSAASDHCIVMGSVHTYKVARYILSVEMKLSLSSGVVLISCIIRTQFIKQHG